MNVLLVNPRWDAASHRRQRQAQHRRRWPPLDLAVAAALLRRDGHDVAILDNHASRLGRRRLQAIARRHDRVVLTSSPHDRWQCPALDIEFFLDTAAALDPSRLIVMGAHVTERTEAVAGACRARWAILGEPEETLRALLEQPDPSKVPGIAYRDGRRYVRTPPRPPLDLNDLPLPAFDLLPMSRYRYELLGARFATLESSRGCPWRCSFCYQGMHAWSYRRKRPDRFLREIDHCVHRFGIRHLYFMDLEFTVNRTHAVEICEGLLRRGSPVSWCCQTRVDTVDQALLNLMHRAGCRLVHYGVESGSQRVLDAAGKRLRLEQARAAIRMTEKAGIESLVFCNFGFPGETAEEMESTMRFVLQLDPRFAAFHLLVPFPGTRLARQTGLDPESFPARAYPCHVATHDLGELRRRQRRAYRRFVARPRFAVTAVRAVSRGPLVGQLRLLASLLR